MIKYSYTNPATLCQLPEALAWVANTTVNADRVTMTGTVQVSAFALLPAYSPVADVQSFTCAYDSGSTDSPSKQLYTYLMTLPEFSSGTPYPA